MMWVFAILIVLAMGVVAMLATGRGEPMRRAYDDRPDSVVPADRRILAEDLAKVRFPLAVRGYRMSEVDALLQRLAREMAPPPEPSPDVAPEISPTAEPEVGDETADETVDETVADEPAGIPEDAVTDE
ncbi:MAG: DivIVA domain-containing protein [Nocardioidaceae bacterium]|nr:DivIVA domain-containing protein [Nocardioidaceae bacterium]